MYLAVLEVQPDEVDADSPECGLADDQMQEAMLLASRHEIMVVTGGGCIIGLRWNRGPTEQLGYSDNDRDVGQWWPKGRS